ncbi:MAG: hypothetical protein F6K63_19455 [Moorea sp. SIO1G6]|uniref:nSTAND1 domain-containing NTPase n=1 Tax=Moorena sp. SIO1G6 TaxID=2607840 RepID=UPI0013C004F3|nr:caspase family protein [Moorena sp. SIO1G6]NET66445.1 hypothetical protein [Moorena sp. SIO1G6]
MFSRNLAFITGINNYTNGISPLNTAVNDAKKLVEILRKKHDYEVWECLDEVATLSNFNKFLSHTLPEKVTENDRLLFYFAGHGVALNGDDGPAGYLIPQDAKLGDTNSYLPMTKLHDALIQLPCRHFLGILDCCFAGAFKWSSTRDLLTSPEVIHQERYDRFISDPAWQIITSSASDQKALDNFNLDSVRGQVGNHSPFASALLDALEGAADIYPPATNGKPAGDGVITATELYLHLRDRVEIPTEKCRLRQTPGIWCLNKHDKGEYIFLSPGHELNLPPAPPLDQSQNPYRGLKSFEEKHSALFFGRTLLVEKLQNFVKANPLTVVLGASGSGKSSLVKGGLIPNLRQYKTWCILPPIRPGETPLQALNNVLCNANLPNVEPQNPEHNLAMSIDVWAKNNPNSKLLLFIDQSEEIITLCRNLDERQEFFQQILTAINAHGDKLRVILTLRSDFEPQVRDAGLRFVPTDYNVENTVLKNRWHSRRFIVPGMTRGELKEAIEKPAQARVMYFQPHELVEQLIDEVADMPGALPLLSFALSELFLLYLRRQREAQYRGITIDRALTQADYQELGGVMRSLTQRADEEYQKLVNENPAYDQVIRHVMLRMVALGGGELARRRVPLSELEYPPAKNSLVKEVIERFSTARLLVEGQDSEGNPDVEPAHDALVRGWQRLLGWKQEEEESLLLQRRLTPAAQEWESQQRARFLWHTNPRLDLLKKVLNSEHNWLNQVETKFVRRSVRRKSFNTRRNWVVAIAVMLGLGTGLVFSLIGQRNALISQIQTDRQAAEVNLPHLEASLASLRAAKSLKDWPWYLFLFKPEPKLKRQVLTTVRKVAYGVRERNRLEKHRGRVIGLGISQDDSRIGSVDETGLICIWDRSGKLLKNHCKADQAGYLDSASFNPDVSLVAIITSDWNPGRRYGPRMPYSLNLWNLENEQEYPLVIADLIYDTLNLAREVVFSKDGKQLALMSESNKNDHPYDFRYWELSDQDLSVQKISKNQFKGEPQFSMLWLDSLDPIYSSDGKTVTFPKHQRFSNDYKNTLVLQKPSSPDKITIETKHTWIERAVFSPDGQQLITAGRDGLISIWDFKANQVPDSSDNPKLFSSSGQLKRYEGSSTNNLFQECHSEFTTDLWEIFSPDQKLKVTTGFDGTVCLWDSNNTKLAKLPGIQNSEMIVSFSPDGKLLATTGLVDRIVKLWDVETKEQVAEFKVENETDDYSNINLSFSHDSKQVAMVEIKDDDKEILGLWKIKSLDELMVQGCNWVRDYLENNPNVSESDRHLCENVNK